VDFSFRFSKAGGGVGKYRKQKKGERGVHLHLTEKKVSMLFEGRRIDKGPPESDAPCYRRGLMGQKVYSERKRKTQRSGSHPLVVWAIKKQGWQEANHGHESSGLKFLETRIVLGDQKAVHGKGQRLCSSRSPWTRESMNSHQRQLLGGEGGPIGRGCPNQKRWAL